MDQPARYHRSIAVRIIRLIKVAAPATFERVWERKERSPQGGIECFINTHGFQFTCDVLRRITVVDLDDRSIIFNGQFWPQSDDENWWAERWQTYSMDRNACEDRMLPVLRRLLVLEDLADV